MRPVEFGEALAVGTRLILFSADKPDRFFRVIKFWMDETREIALALKTGVPSYQVEDEYLFRLVYKAQHRLRATDGIWEAEPQIDLSRR